MGGRGTWDLIRRYPTTFAAAAPMAAPALPADARLYASQNIWSVNGDKDSTVQANRDTIAAIRAIGGSPIYTELANHGHDSWRTIYPDAQFLDWIYAQRLGGPWSTVSKAPMISGLTGPAVVAPTGGGGSGMRERAGQRPRAGCRARVEEPGGGQGGTGAAGNAGGSSGTGGSTPTAGTAAEPVLVVCPARRAGRAAVWSCRAREGRPSPASLGHRAAPPPAIKVGGAPWRQVPVPRSVGRYQERSGYCPCWRSTVGALGAAAATARARRR